MTFKEDGQEYAQVIKMLGNGRLEALCFDGSKRLANVRSLSCAQKSFPWPFGSALSQPGPQMCILPFLLIADCWTLLQIRGKMRKKVWINQGDIILLSLRDFQDNKGDVILKYTADEARSLKTYGELPEHAKINETDTFGQGEDGEAYFEFGDADSDEDSDEDDKKKEVDIDDI